MPALIVRVQAFVARALRVRGRCWPLCFVLMLTCGGRALAADTKANLGASLKSLGQQEIRIRIHRNRSVLQEHFEARYKADGRVQLTLNSNDFCGPHEQAWLGAFQIPASDSLRLDQRMLYHAQLNLSPQSKGGEPAGGLSKMGQSFRHNPARSIRGGPHTARYFLNQYDIALSPTAQKTVNSSLDKLCNTKLWQPEKAVLIQATSGVATSGGVGTDSGARERIDTKSKVKTTSSRRLKVQYFKGAAKSRTAFMDYNRAKCRKVGRTKAKKQAVLECFIEGYGLALLVDPYFSEKK